MVIASKEVKCKGDKVMNLVALVEPNTVGVMADKLPIIAVNNTKVKFEFGKKYNCSIYFKKDKFNNLYKVEGIN